MPSSEKPSHPPFDYTMPEWIQHYKFRAQRSGEVEATRLRREIVQMFERQYPKLAERRYKQERFVAAMTYLDTHMKDFDVGDVAVEGSSASGDLVSKHLILALYTLYCQVPDDRINEDFPPGLVFQIIEQYKLRD